MSTVPLASLDYGLVMERFTAILAFPVENPEFIPTLIPIFLGLVVIELYFGRYAFEDLGWNSAVSNSVLLITTALSLILQLDLISIPPSGPRAVVAYGVLALGLVILLLNFYHVWPAEIAFNVSSGFTAYTTVYITIAAVYEGLPVGRNTVAAGVMVFALFYVTFKLVKRSMRTVRPQRFRR